MVMDSTHLPTAPNYVEQIQAWRADREQKLRADDSWLTLCALAWLNEGDNSIGSADTCDIQLPASSVPPQLGTLHFKDGVGTLSVTADTSVLVDGQPTRQAMLKSDADHQKPSLVTVGDVSFFIIKRSDQYAIRARDKNSAVLKAFGGCTWFDVNPNYRVAGKFVAHTPARELPVVNVLGMIEATANPGVVHFELGGRAYAFEAFAGGKDSLFIVFRDATAGKTTYGSSRFLYAAMQSDGTVDLDFNKAYNPPCAFTTFATCPLPLPGNILPIAIEAGETLANGAH